MKTLTKTKFEPVLIFTNEERIKETLKSANSIADQLNEKLNASEAFIGNTLTDTGKLDILHKGLGAFMSLLRKQFQFPNATDEFNVTSIGKEKEFEPIKSSLSNIVSLFGAYEYKLVDGQVKISDKGIKAIEKVYMAYTVNEKQNEAYKLALKIADNLNTAFDYGYLDRSDFYSMQNALKLAKLPRSGGDKLLPNISFISRIKEDGGVSSMY